MNKAEFIKKWCSKESSEYLRLDFEKVIQSETATFQKENERLREALREISEGQTLSRTSHPRTGVKNKIRWSRNGLMALARVALTDKEITTI